MVISVFGTRRLPTNSPSDSRSVMTSCFLLGTAPPRYASLKLAMTICLREIRAILTAGVSTVARVVNGAERVQTAPGSQPPQLFC